MQRTTRKLGECLSLIKNGATIKQTEGGGGIPITRIETLSQGQFHRERLGYANIFDVSPYSDYILQENDILVSHINSRAYLGRSVQYHKEGDEIIIHGMNLLRIQTNPVLLDCNYAYYFFQTPYFKKCVDNKRTDAVNQSSINISNICEIEIDLPPIQEQRKIASILWSIDRKIALNRQINRNLEALAKQIYDYWFVQFDFPDENGKPYKSSGGKMVWNKQLKRFIPEKWEVVELGSVIKLEDSKRVPLSTFQRENRKGLYPYYGATGIMDYIDDYLFDDELILLAEDGSTSDIDGFPVVQYVWGKIWVNNHAHIISPRNPSHKVYTYFMLKTIPVKLIETGSIQKKINQDNLLSYQIFNVSTSILDAFTKIATPIWKKKMIVTEEINALIKQRDELLPLLMNGQVNSDLSAY